MKIIEILPDMREEIIYNVCELLSHSNRKLEEAMFKLKELKESESDYRISGGSYRMGGYPGYREDERRYRDDFRYR